MYVGDDVNGMMGLGKDPVQMIDQIAEAARRGFDKNYTPNRIDDWTSFLDQRYSVKQVLLFGVVSYVGYNLLRKWRNW